MTRQELEPSWWDWMHQIDVQRECSNNMKSRRPPPPFEWSRPVGKTIPITNTQMTHTSIETKDSPSSSSTYTNTMSRRALVGTKHTRRRKTRHIDGVCLYRSRKANGPVCYIKAIKLTPPIVVTEPDSCNAELIELIARLSSRLPGDISNESFFLNEMRNLHWQ